MFANKTRSHERMINAEGRGPHIDRVYHIIPYKQRIQQEMFLRKNQYKGKNEYSFTYNVHTFMHVFHILYALSIVTVILWKCHVAVLYSRSVCN